VEPNRAISLRKSTTTGRIRDGKSESIPFVLFETEVIEMKKMKRLSALRLKGRIQRLVAKS